MLFAYWKQGEYINIGCDDLTKKSTNKESVEDDVLTPKDMVSFSCQIAAGMVRYNITILTILTMQQQQQQVSVDKIY
jgi:hypothetical protein